MQFRPPPRRNPFDNFVIGLLAHVVGLAIFVGGVVAAVSEQALWPLIAGGVALTVLEGVWLYFRLRH